jgi:Ca2+-binding RTX toxin-like protein
MSGGAGNDTMLGGAGDDIYIVDSAGDVAIEDANAGVDTVQAAVDHVLAANVENLVLTGTAIGGIGNDLDNMFTGNRGNNSLDGGGGVDTLELTGRRSQYTFTGLDATRVQISDRIAARDGMDTVVNIETVRFSDQSIALASLVSALVDGTSGNDSLLGTIGNDRLNGLAGNDLLDGAGGSDTMAGGLGDDTYIVDAAGDAVTEDANAGSDTVQTSVTHVLALNVEHLVLTGTAAISGTGNALSNTLKGNRENNTLDGGDGVDTLVLAGRGADYSFTGLDATRVQVRDGVASRDGTDIIINIETVRFADGSFALNTLFSTTVNGTAGIDNLVGTVGMDRMNGLAGNDRLDGRGGNDTMLGGQGDDVYVVSEAGDSVQENANEGTDTVEAELSYTLGANVENLVLAGSATHGTGNDAANRLTGNGLDNMLDGGAGDDVMLGAAGNDTYVVDSQRDVVSETRGAGQDTVRSSDDYRLGDHVENLVLTGMAVSGTGNALDNTIIGNSVNNLLAGGGGRDTIDGAEGVDTLLLTGRRSDYIFTGFDRIWVRVVDREAATTSRTLVVNVENVRFVNETVALASLVSDTANGTAGNDTLFGTIGRDVLTGLAGDDWLDGGASDDTMSGGAGNDTFVVADAGDLIRENRDEGWDTVRSFVSHTLVSHVEELILLDGALDGTGNELGNRLTGNDLGNRLNGGAGVDVMAGGKGNDIYVVDRSDDVIQESNHDDVDTVISSADYRLSDNVENLELTGLASISGTGNRLDNKLTGNGGNNRLDGGVGKDQMVGGVGNDTYVVDDPDDTVTEQISSDEDTVEASLDYRLTAFVENLLLTGNGNLNATGNNLNNVITGNGGHNRLDGGEGNDTLRGGEGDDVYIVDRIGDVVIEGQNAGNDTIHSAVNLSEGLAANVENLVLTGTAIIGIGNTLNNSLTGNGGANRLTGGLGNDILSGLSGNDTFVFASRFGADRITDFVSGAGLGDVIQLSLGAAFDSISEVHAAARQTGSDTIISF